MAYSLTLVSSHLDFSMYLLSLGEVGIREEGARLTELRPELKGIGPNLLGPYPFLSSVWALLGPRRCPFLRHSSCAP